MYLSFINMQMLCSHLAFFQWLQSHLLRCPFKYITGIDCPGCGFQRSVLALAQGDFHQSFALYPPAIPMLLFFTYGILERRFKLDTQNEVIKKTGFIVVGSIVLISYCIKMYGQYHHSISA